MSFNGRIRGTVNLPSGLTTTGSWTVREAFIWRKNNRWTSNNFQGTQYGYTSGGTTTVAVNPIDKFPFSSDTNASDVGDLGVARRGVAGQQY